MGAKMRKTLAAFGDYTGAIHRQMKGHENSSAKLIFVLAWILLNLQSRSNGLAAVVLLQVIGSRLEWVFPQTFAKYSESELGPTVTQA